MSMQPTRKNNVSILPPIIDTLSERVHAMDMNISSFRFAQVGQKLELGYGD